VPKLKKKAMIKILCTFKKTSVVNNYFFYLQFLSGKAQVGKESSFLPICVANHSTGKAPLNI